jgi:hypothetical protein
MMLTNLTRGKGQYTIVFTNLARDTYGLYVRRPTSGEYSYVCLHVRAHSLHGAHGRVGSPGVVWVVA